MADNDEVDGTNARRSDWEVVSLTASAYGAGPDPTEVQQKDDSELNTYDEAETSRALFMSGHFVFPPSQHENLPLEPEDDEIYEAAAGKGHIAELGVAGIESMTKDEMDHNLSSTTLSFDPPAYGGPASYADHKLNEAAETDSFDPPEESSQLSKALREEDYFAPNLPSGAWWKKRAASLYAQAKDANAFWSVFIAAAVMGLVILGQQWQQERWQVLQQKWHLSLRDEKMGKMMGPIYRMKDLIMGGQHRGPLIRGSP